MLADGRDIPRRLAALSEASAYLDRLEMQQRLSDLSVESQKILHDYRDYPLLRGLAQQWDDDPREAARRGGLLATYAAQCGDYSTAIGMFRALNLPESEMWECLQPIIEGNSDFADEVFAKLYEPDFGEA